jgi:hypothetical protein
LYPHQVVGILKIQLGKHSGPPGAA